MVEESGAVERLQAVPGAGGFRFVKSHFRCHLALVQTEIVTFKSFRSKQTARRLLAGETLTLAYGKEIVADIVPRRPKLKHRPTMDEIMAPVVAAAKHAQPTRDLILEDRERFRR